MDGVSSSTPPMLVVRIFEILTVVWKLDVIICDCTTAFMHAPEEDDVYTMPPEGYRVPGMVWKLLKAINGRRNAGRSFQ
eukprot:14412542-Alexandrium_andersonii.AAC.1